MRTAAHRLLIALLLALIGNSYLADGPGARAQDDTVGGAGDGSLQLGLPFPVGETWWFSGPHAPPVPTTGANRAMSFKTAQFASEAGRTIVAMRGGSVTRPCPNMVKINHGTFSTVYYPVGNVALAAGATVARGQALGVTTPQPGGCAGALDDQVADVSVWVEQGGNVVDPVGMDVGGWTVQNDGFLLRGSTYSYSVANDGEAGSTGAPFARVWIGSRDDTGDDGGLVGSRITYALAGYPVDAPVTLEWRRADGSVVPLGTTRTSSGGGAEGTVVIPESPNSGNNDFIHALVARTATFRRQVSARTLQTMGLNTYAVARGETVTLRVTGFVPNASVPINVAYDGQGFQETTQRMATNQFGTGTASYTISASAPLGRGGFRIYAGSLLAEADYGFEVVGQPSLDFSFNAGVQPSPGDAFVAYVRKFPANSDISLSIQVADALGNFGPVYQLGTGRTDALGASSISTAVPLDISAGPARITATGGGRSVTYSGGISPKFSVSPGSAPPGGQVTIDLAGRLVGSTFTLDWWDGEVWQPLGEVVVPSGRRLAVVVPPDAPVGLTGRFGQREYNDRGFPIWPRQANVLVTDPGSNTPPTANAGADRTVSSPTGGGVAVALNGAGSADPGGGIASYTWRENGAQIATGASPTVTLAPGVHTIQLTVVDTGGLAATDTVVVTVARPPVANAGPDQTVADPEGNGQAVSLNGSGSSDPDGTIASYVWREGTTQLATGAQPTVTLAPGAHTVTLTVTDNLGLTATDTVVVTVAVPRPPVANAGPDQTVADPENDGQAVALTGGGSSDPDGNGTIASYVWREGTTQLATGVGPTVTLPVGVHTIVLTVTDTTARTATDTVVVTVTGSRPPVANAGPDQTVADPERNGQAVALNGSGSSDPDGTIASYVWREGATQLATGRTPTVTLSAGVHTIVLTVTDNAGLTATDTVVVTVTAPAGPPTVVLDKESSKFNGLVIATLTGFTPNGAVTLRWPNAYPVDANGPPTTDLLASGTADASGRATLTFRTPLQPFKATGYVVTARDAAGKSATDTLRVIPRITLAPAAEGPTSTRLRVYFYGFGPGETIEVRWHSGPTNASGFVVIKTLTVASNGRASSIVVIPRASAVGRHLVVGKVIGVSRSASTPFDVTAGGGSVDDPTATPTATASATPDATATPEATPMTTPAATATPTPTETATLEPVPTDTPTPEPTPTATPVPNTSPVAAAGEDQDLTDADGTGDEPVQLDGSASTDPEGGELTYAWSVDGVEVATGPTPTVTLPVGTTTVVLTVSDGQGATAIDEVTVTVEVLPPGEGRESEPEETVVAPT